MKHALARVLTLALAGTGLAALPSAGALADHCTPATIEEVQGTGSTSPLAGQEIEVTGVVTSNRFGDLHIEQVSVHADSARQGIGRALIENVCARAAGRHPAVTLTTFKDVPWNAPYYARLGFQIVTEEELTPGLRRLREQEKARGLDRWPRVCMRRPCRAQD